MIKKSVTLMTLLLVANATDTFAFETSYYYDGEHEPNLSLGGKLASQYSNSLLSMTLAGHCNTSKYKAVGYIQNNYSLNGGRMMGTGTVIDCHTILTNAHVIDNQYNKATKPSAVRFMMNRDGSYLPFNFAIKQIRKIKGSDLALLYTYKDMSQYVKPLTFAAEEEINNVTKGKAFYSLGYPYYASNWGTKRYKYKAIFLRYSNNKKEMMMKDKIRGGNSGSPLVNGKFQIYGVRTYGERVDGYDENKWAKYELGGSIAIKGDIRDEIMRNKY